MREQIQLIRVSHPHLGSYEADIVKTESPMEAPDQFEYVAYLPVSSESTPFAEGERVVIKWGDNNLRGRGMISEHVNAKTCKIRVTLARPSFIRLPR